MASPRKANSLLTLTSMAALGLAAALTPQIAHADGTLTTILTGLSAPYGMTYDYATGALYVADAGAGGTGPSIVNGNNQTVYFGDTGGVTEYLHGVITQPFINLPSLGPQVPGEVTGLTGLALEGGDLYGVFGLGTTPDNRTTLEAVPGGNDADELGTIVDLSTGKIVSDLVPYEANNYTTNNPGAGALPIEANPYGLTALPGGKLAATDGGGNVVLTTSTTPASSPALLTVLGAMPNPLFPGQGGPTYQSVPTSITTGPGGDLYAAEFTGYPFPAGGADILKIDPTTGTTSVFASGFTGIVGASFGANGDLYVLDTSMAGPIPDAGLGELLQYDPTDGTTTTLMSLPAATYTGLVAGPGNTLYISSQPSSASSLTRDIAGGIVQEYVPAAVPEVSPIALLALGLLPVGLLLRARRKTDTI